MDRRLRTLIFWLLGRRNGVSLAEVLRFVFLQKTHAAKIRSMVLSVEEEGEFYALRLKGVERPLYYPREFDLHALYVVITELLFPADWHYYESFGTVIESGDVVVDCGASEGLFSLIASGKCRKVYAIEPNPRFIDSMGMTFRGVGNFEAIPAALSEREGEAMLSGKDMTSSLSKEGAIKVRVETLDGLFLDKGEAVSYIKADVEGQEVEVLRGASGLIRRYGPKLSIATYHHPDHGRLIADFLKEINPRYTIRFSGIDYGTGAPMLLHAWTESKR